MAHPTDCNKFFNCAHEGTVHMKAHQMSCPDGLFFNSNLNICDYSSKVDCENGQRGYVRIELKLVIHLYDICLRSYCNSCVSSIMRAVFMLACLELLGHFSIEKVFFYLVL